MTILNRLLIGVLPSFELHKRHSFQAFRFRQSTLDGGRAYVRPSPNLACFLSELSEMVRWDSSITRNYLPKPRKGLHWVGASDSKPRGRQRRGSVFRYPDISMQRT